MHAWLIHTAMHAYIKYDHIHACIILIIAILKALSYWNLIIVMPITLCVYNVLLPCLQSGMWVWAMMWVWKHLWIVLIPLINWFVKDRWLAYSVLVRQVSAVVLIRGANSSSHPTNVSMYGYTHSLMHCRWGLCIGPSNSPCCMHANMHCTDSSQVGGVVVGLGLLLGHMTKCIHKT